MEHLTPTIAAEATTPLGYEQLGHLDSVLVRVVAWTCLVLGVLGTMNLMVDGVSFVRGHGPNWVATVLSPNDFATFVGGLQQSHSTFECVFLVASGLALLRRKPQARGWMFTYSAISFACFGGAFFCEVWRMCPFVNLRMDERVVRAIITFFQDNVFQAFFPVLIVIMATNRQLAAWLRR